MPAQNIRNPAVAGQFYASSASALRKEVESLVLENATKSEVIACMLPHAGYMYSGEVAGHTVSSIVVKDKIILLGPNHTGAGSAYSIVSQGVWQTPLGKVNVEASLAGALLKDSPYLKDDPRAHSNEHSLEVELPFFQYFKSDFRIVPIAFLSDDIGILKEIGRDIARVIKETQEANSVLIVASSDMTHYEPLAAAQKKDKEAISAILNLDADRLIKKISQFNITMCGYAPVVVMIEAAIHLGATKGTLIDYQTSAKASGDETSVVGYAGIVIT